MGKGQKVRSRLIDPLADPAAVAAVWRPLSEATKPTYFLAWPWVENWLATVPRHIWLRLLVVEGADGLPAAACFLGRRLVRRTGVVFSRALYLNATGHPELDDIVIEHNGWLARSPHEWPLARLLDHLPRRGWDELVLDAVDPSSIAGYDGGWSRRLKVQRSAPCPIVELDRVRASSGGYLALLGSQTRSQIRRASRLYEERGPVTFDVATDEAKARSIFDELVVLHQATWARRGQRGVFDGYLRTFHERLIARRIRDGEIQLVRVRAGDHTIGCLYNFVWNGVVSFYQSGFVYEQDNRLKPGLVCHAEAVSHAARAGHRTYDFLGGDARYKQSLATSSGELVWASVQRPRPQLLVEDSLRRLRDRVRSLLRDETKGDRVESER